MAEEPGPIVEISTEDEIRIEEVGVGVEEEQILEIEEIEVGLKEEISTLTVKDLDEVALEVKVKIEDL